MWELLRSILGDVTFDELLLVGLLFFCVVSYAYVPRAGEAVGRLFERDGPKG